MWPRNRWLLAASVAGLLLALPVCARADWTTIGGNPEHTSALESSSLKPPFKVLWSKTFPVAGATKEDVGWRGPEQGYHFPLYEQATYPVIGDGEIILGTSNSGNPQHYEIHAFNEQTGQPLWTYVDPEEASGAHLALDGTHLVADGLGLKRSLVAFDVATGSILWTRAGDSSEPLVATGGIVYFVEAFIGAELIAASEETGQVLWEGSMFSDTRSGPTISGGLIYVMGSDFWGSNGERSPDGYVFDESTGALLRRYSADSGEADDGCSGPVVFNDGRLWTGECGFNQLEQPYGDIVNAQSGVSEGHYISSALNSVVLDGEEQLQLVEHDECEPVPDPIDPTYCEYVFRSATLTAQEEPSGKALWTFNGDGQLDSGPIRVGHDVYVGSASGKLYALDDQTGQPVWSISMPDGFRPEYYEQGSGPTGMAADGDVLAIVAGDSLTILTPSTSSSPPSGSSAGAEESSGVTGAGTGAPGSEASSKATSETQANPAVTPSSEDASNSGSITPGGTGTPTSSPPAGGSTTSAVHDCLERGQPRSRRLGRGDLKIEIALHCPLGVAVHAMVDYTTPGSGPHSRHTSFISRITHVAGRPEIVLSTVVAVQTLRRLQRLGVHRLTIDIAPTAPRERGFSLGLS
jgi:outer membrane protein assembly factor BamB